MEEGSILSVRAGQGSIRGLFSGRLREDGRAKFPQLLRRDRMGGYSAGSTLRSPMSHDSRSSQQEFVAQDGGVRNRGKVSKVLNSRHKIELLSLNGATCRHNSIRSKICCEEDSKRGQTRLVKAIMTIVINEIELFPPIIFE